MAGGKLPVLEIEQLWLKKDGRGLYVYDDGDVLASAPWVGVSSNSIGASIKFLPAASAQAWLKVSYASGGSSTTSTGYIPIFGSHDVASMGGL